jgi:hypothetical protein
MGGCVPTRKAFTTFEPGSRDEPSIATNNGVEAH